ncbi:MAG: hypothetical protein P8010_25310 [Desulfosarcinaceae bacterium]
MSSNIIKYAVPILIGLLLAVWVDASFAGDLDDGIKGGEKVAEWDTLDQPSVNISFIKRKAMASAARGGNSFLNDSGGDTAIGGFINQPGADFDGDVTIIFNGEDISAVSE